MENNAPQFVTIQEEKQPTDNPLVSIITPVLNGIKYLDVCIQSVLNQSYPHIEHIFIDGGSTDGTVEILSSYQARNPARIRLVSEPGTNAMEAWNKGWEVAKGDILEFLGADDFLAPGAVLTVVEFFKLNSDAYFVFGACNTINEIDGITRRTGTKEFNLREAINFACDIPTRSAFYRREVIERVGFLGPSVYACDFDYWIRVGKKFRIHRVDEVLSSSRLHKDCISISMGQRIYHRELFIISRRHGGSILSWYAIGYFKYVATERARPILGPIYPFINPSIKRVTSRLVQRAVRTILKITEIF